MHFELFLAGRARIFYGRRGTPEDATSDAQLLHALLHLLLVLADRRISIVAVIADRSPIDSHLLREVVHPVVLSNFYFVKSN